MVLAATQNTGFFEVLHPAEIHRGNNELQDNDNHERGGKYS